MGNTVAALETLTLADCKVAQDHAPVDRCEIVTDIVRLEQLSSDWQRLWESDRRAEIFQTPEWSRAWWRAYGESYRLCSIVVFAGQEVAGIVPLVERDGKLQFLGTPEADYADIICEERRAAEVLTLAVQTLMESVPDWKECAFHHLSRHSRVYRYHRELPWKLRAWLRCVPAARQHTIILRNQREEVFKVLLGKHHTRRIKNKLQKAGELRFRHLESAQEAAAYLPAFVRQHVRRHAVLGRRSVCSTPEFAEFVRALMREVGLSGRMRFGVLELNGQPLAFALGFEVNGKFMLYQHTFDLDAWHYTPGELLLWSVLDYAKDHISREFDFGKGDETYKDRFANYSRETFSLYLEPRGPAGMVRSLVRSGQVHLQPVVSRVEKLTKSRPAMLRAFRELRMWATGARSRLQQAHNTVVMVQSAGRLTAELFGKFIWSRRATEVFARETSRWDGDALIGALDTSDRDVSEAQFGDLVDMAWEHSEILTLNELPQCRQRMKNGDRLYVVREKGSVVLLCWVSGWSGAAADSATPRMEATPGTPAVLVDEYWRARDRDLSLSYRLLLSILTREAACHKSDLLVHCASNQPALRMELERQSFAPRFHTTRRSILGRQREFISRYRENSTLRPSQAA